MIIKYINFIFNKIKNLDIKIYKIMKKGLLFSFFISIISLIMLVTYQLFYTVPDLFYIGISLFETSLFFAIMFFICALAFDTIEKEIF